MESACAGRRARGPRERTEPTCAGVDSDLFLPAPDPKLTLLSTWHPSETAEWGQDDGEWEEHPRPKRVTEWRVTDPDAVTNYHRTPAEHQEFLTFAAAVAGKDSRITSKQLGRAWSSLRYREVKRRMRPSADPRAQFAQHVKAVKQIAPYDLIRGAQGLSGTLHRAGVTPHTGRAKAFQALANAPTRPESATLGDLTQIHGVGQKSSRFYLTHSRPGQQHAVLDRHILGWMRDHGEETPKDSPTSAKRYGELESRYFGLAGSHLGPAATCAHCKHAGASSHADLDFNIWKERSRRRKRSWRGKSYKADQVWSESITAVIRGAGVPDVARVLLEVS